MCKKILVVDDDICARDVISKAITRKFHLDIMYAESVDEALNLVNTIEFCSVITDISLPGKSGHHLVHYLIEKDIPVVVVTGYSPNMVFVDKRVKACFYKPINWDNFALTLKEMCKIQDIKEEEEVEEAYT
jgi:DNA-binding NtrC family response regulator